MASCDHDAPFDLDNELAIARSALEQGDLRHAVHHLSGVLIEAPQSLEAEDLVQWLFRAARDPLSIVSLEGGAYVGVAVLRARFLERLAKPTEAIRLLLEAQCAVPEHELLDVERYTREPELLNDTDLEQLASAVYPFCASERAPRYMPLLDALLDRHEPGLRLGVAAARCMRAVGRLDDAIDLCEEVTKRTPAYLSFVALGSAYHDAGRDDDTLPAWRKAIEHEPDDVPVRLDIGDLLLETRHFAEARAAYAEALERAPDHEWALPSWLYARWKETDDLEARAHLDALVREAAPESRAHQLAQLVWPYRFSLTPPGNSIMGMARNALANGSGMVEVSVSSVEAPSVVAALEQAARRAGSESPKVSFGEMPDPDPRVPMAKVRRVLWTYASDEGARPALPQPEPRISARVHELADSPFDLDSWSKAAALAAVGLAEHDIDSLFATMVHPPALPEEADAWTHRFRIQVAAAFLVSNIGDGWDGSARREGLHDLLFGPVDWTSSAGVIAACNLARTQPALANGVLELLDPLLRLEGGPVHFSNIIVPLAACITWLPELTPEIDDWLENVQRYLD